MFSGHIFSSSFWRSYWVALRRSKRDQRDRKNVIKFTVGLLFFTAYYGYVIGSFALNGAGSILLIFVSVIAGALLLGWISNRSDEKAAEREALADVDTVLRTRLAQDCFIIATVLSRASSEATLREKELPSGVEVITRRVQIDKLRTLSEWETLTSEVRELLLLPDGHWSQRQIQSTYTYFEIVRCLRWVLCADNSLTPLSAFPKMNYGDSHSIFANPTPILSGGRLRPTWDLRVERNKADAFFSRCLAEAIGRGTISASGDETKTWASDVNETARLPEVRDVLAGVQTISEVDDHTLRYLACLGLQRYDCLRLLIDLQGKSSDRQAWEAFCFRMAPSGKDEAEIAESIIL